MKTHHILIVYINAFIASVSSTSCNNPYTCANQTLNENIILVDGYKGAFGPQTSLICDTCFCNGALSCDSIQFIHLEDGQDSVLRCHGTTSCSNTIIVSNTAPMHCDGFNSCIFSSISSTDNNYLNCRGYGSCSETHINSVEEIDASAPYSLYKATIDSNESSSALSITLSGDYAGYGATIRCREQHQCNIYCDGDTSCYMLYIDCIGACIIHNQTQHTIFPTTNITQHQMLSNENIFDFEPLLNSDDHCNTVFDSLQELFQEDIIHATDTICCRGKSSCYGSRFQLEPKGDIICSGNTACSTSTITSNNGSVFCEAEHSCWKANMNHAAFTYCMGYWSCAQSIITSSHRIVCAANAACRETTITSAGSDLNLYFGGYFAGIYAEVYCNDADFCNIVCTGYRSCYDMTLVCDGICNVTCDRVSECPIGWLSSTTLKPILKTTKYPLEFTSKPTYYPLISTANTFASNPIKYTVYQTQYSSTSFPNSDTKQYPSDRNITRYVTITDDKSKLTLPIILIISLIALLSIIGAVIWHWNRRRKQKGIFKKNNNKDVIDNDDNVKHNISKKEESMESMYDVNNCVVDETITDCTKPVVEHVEGDGEQRENIPQQRKESLLDEMEGNVDYNTQNDVQKSAEYITADKKAAKITTGGISIHEDDIYHHGAIDA